MSVLDLAAALKLKALKIISDEQEALDKANIALENHVFLIKKMRVEKVGKQKEADKKKELNKNMPTGGLMKRMAKMRGKILAQADITEKSGLALDDEEISKTTSRTNYNPRSIREKGWVYIKLPMITIPRLDNNNNNNNSGTEEVTEEDNFITIRAWKHNGQWTNRIDFDYVRLVECEGMLS